MLQIWKNPQVFLSILPLLEDNYGSERMCNCQEAVTEKRKWSKIKSIYSRTPKVDIWDVEWGFMDFIVSKFWLLGLWEAENEDWTLGIYKKYGNISLQISSEKHKASLPKRIRAIIKAKDGHTKLKKDCILVVKGFRNIIFW